jgi:hypothetical protein
MVLLLPPAPAALVELGLAFATLSFWSAAARRRIAVFGPPGGVGEDGRPELAPAVPTGELTGDEGRGDDYPNQKYQKQAITQSSSIPNSRRSKWGWEWRDLG